MNPNANNCPPVYTASRIAAALGISKPAVLRALRGVPAAAQVQVPGGMASTWTFDAVPVELREKLLQRVRQLGHRDVPALLADLKQQWQPRVPWHQIPQEYRTTAEKLQLVLVPLIVRVGELSAKELVEAGLQSYRRVFGHEISERHFRSLLKRTQRRDKNREEWHRLELYLDGRYERAYPKKVPDPKSKEAHTPLLEYIEHLSDRANPTAEDRAFLLDAAFRHLDRLNEAAREKETCVKLKASLIDFLLESVPALAKNQESFRRNFDRKHAAWLSASQSPAALKDQRAVQSGRRAPQFPEDEKKIFAEAVQLDGNEAGAHRNLRRRGELSQEFTEHYEYNIRRNKSYVPAVTRQRIKSRVEMCLPLHRGPWEAKMKGPYIPRDWSDTAQADFFSADDVTWNHYAYHQDASGQFHVFRGEGLLMTDLRTGYPIGFVLIAGKYNARYIRSLILRAHDDIGLPHKGFLFENGVWASRWIEGVSKKGGRSDWRDTEGGLRERGLELEVRHAYAPRAKPIENTLGRLQERMRPEPGFVGFNERTDKRERMQEFLARVRRGSEHPGNELLELNQWVKRIGEILEEYAHEPQNGQMLPGVSPAEMWEAGLDRRPLRKLPDEARWILATNKIRKTVGHRQIVLDIGSGLSKQRWTYTNGEVPNFEGQEVFCFYHLEKPELLTVSDLKRRHYFAVRGIRLPAMTATREQFAAANAQISAADRTVKAVFGQITHRRVDTLARASQYDERTKEMGRFVNAEVAALDEEQKRDGARAARAIKRAGELGLSRELLSENIEAVDEGTLMMVEAGREHQAKETAGD